jgi:hypothetical protein
LADNYLSSGVRRRIEAALQAGAASAGVIEDAGGAVDTSKRDRSGSEAAGRPALLLHDAPGVFSEQRFRLRRPRGILTGTIDKLLVSKDERQGTLSAEIVDFKTNRFRRAKPDRPSSLPGRDRASGGPGKRRPASAGQLLFEFSEPISDNLLVRSEVEVAASDYRLQMQAYAMAVRELAPQIARVRVTLHFLDPNLEVTLDNELLEAEACGRAVDDAAEAMFSSTRAESFPVHPDAHCRTCAFLRLCPAGRKALNRG